MGTGLVRRTLARTLRVSKAVARLVFIRAAKSVSLQAILLLCNVCFFYAGECPELRLQVPSRTYFIPSRLWDVRFCLTRGRVISLGKLSGVRSHAVLTRASPSAGVKKLRRARFAAAVKLLTDIDEDGLKTLFHFLPAWVKVCCLLFKLALRLDLAYLWRCKH